MEPPINTGPEVFYVILPYLRNKKQINNIPQVPAFIMLDLLLLQQNPISSCFGGFLFQPRLECFLSFIWILTNNIK